MSTVLWESLQAWWPEAILSLGGLLAVLAGGWTRRSQPALGLSWAALLAAGWMLSRVPVASTGMFFGLIVCDPLSAAFRWLSLGVTALVV